MGKRSQNRTNLKGKKTKKQEEESGKLSKSPIREFICKPNCRCRCANGETGPGGFGSGTGGEEIKTNGGG